MTKSFPHRRWLGRALWPALLLMPLSLIVTDCAPPADNGNANDNQNTNGNTNGNQNDNGNANGNENDNGQTGDPESGQVFVEFDFSTTNTDVARALGSDGTEYGFFGEKDPSGSSFDIEHMDVILPTSAAVRTTFDELDRPSQLLGSDRSALLLSYDHAGDEVTAVFVATDGETNLIVATLNSANSRTGSQASFGVGDLCNLITNLTAVTDSVLASCSEDSEGGLCASSIAQAIGAWEAFCQSELILVINELASSVGRGPALTVPLAVVARTASDSVAPDTGVSLRGDVLGGSPPYRFDWEVLAGSPAQPEIIATDAGSISAATVNLSIEGVYSIQLTVFDSVGQSAFFELVILVSADPDALAVDAGAEISDQDPFQATLSAEASGGVPPFSFVWQLFGGPEDGEVTFDDETAAITTAVFSKCGTFIIEVLATDAIEVSTLFSFPVTIIDVTAGLIVDITFPTCADATMQNTCVLLNESLIFGVDVTTDAGGNGQFEYEWEVIDGSNAAVLDDADTASPTLTAIGPDTLTLQVAVTDTATCQKVTDEISIEVIQDSDLTVDILSDGNATLNQPETLLANVSGTVGLLSYEWTVTEGTGSFDDDAAQNVLFTPTSRPLVTVQVTVSDDANGNTATATEELSISTFSVTIVGSSQIKRNAVATFAVSLSDGTPSSVNYLWSVDKQDADDSLDVDTVNVTAADLQLLPQGDGVFDLSVLVTEAGDAENFASDSVVVTVFCSEASRPGAETGAAQLALGSDVVTLTCADPDQTSNRSFRWQQLSGTGVALVDADTANAKFTMLPSTLGFAPLVFECIVQNDATLCERSDSTTVYATPIVAPDDGSLDVTALTGSKVELTCVQQFGSTADEYDWRQVDDNGAEIDPPSVTDVAVDSASGVLTFTAPSSAQELFFECQGIVAGPDGDLAGPFSSDDAAMVTVEYFSVAAVVRDGDSAGGSSLADINVDRIRLSGAGPGEVVFSSTLSGGSPSSGVFQADLDTSQTTTLVSEGGNAPNGGSFGLINLFDVDDAGNLSFVARVSGAPAGGENQGVFTLIDGSAAEVAADGAADINPSGQRFCRFDDVAIAGNGTVFFLAQFDGDDNTGSNEHLDCSGTFLEGIYAHSSGVTSAVAESGSTIVPDSIPGVVFGNTFQQLHSNAAGDVIFAGQDAAATAIGAFIDPATGSLDSIFLNNRGAADTDEVYAADLPADLSIRASGVAAFQADLAGDFGEPTQGIFTNVGSLGTAIVLNGSGSPAGLTISSIEQLAMNAAGDVAFIADGRLLFYSSASGAVVEVRDQSGTAVADGEMVSGLTIDGLADVQLSDAGSIVFSATLSGGGSAIFTATPN